MTALATIAGMLPWLSVSVTVPHMLKTLAIARRPVASSGRWFFLSSYARDSLLSAPRTVAQE